MTALEALGVGRYCIDMSAIAKHKMSVDEFLMWADGREGRWELADGVPVAMAPERIGHGETKFFTGLAFKAALKNAGLACWALVDCAAVRIDARTTFQPDVMVYCGPKLPSYAIEVSNPIVVVEVLSPSTRKVDLGLKARRYFEVASVEHYLILDAEDRSVLRYRSNRYGSPVKDIVDEKMLDFDPPGFTVEVASLFPEL